MFSIETEWLKQFIVENPNGFGRMGYYTKKRFPAFYEHILQSWVQPSEPKHFVERVYQYLNPTCVICPYGKTMKFLYYGTGYVCKLACQCTKDKKLATMIDRYGTEYPLQNPELKEKVKSTLLRRYGVDNFSAAGADKRRATNLDRYGVDTPLKCKEVRDKITASLMRTHGVMYPFQSKEVQSKATATVIDRYGVRSVTQLPEITAKSRQTLINNYGVTSTFGLDSVKQKIAHTFVDKYGSHPSRRHMTEQQIRELNDDSIFTEVYNGLNSVEEVQSYFGVSASAVHIRAQRLELTRKKTSVSKWEAEVAVFVSSLGVEIEQSDRTIVAPREIDIVVKSAGLGIEFDGVYHHSQRFAEEPDGHLSKTAHANRSGYRLIHVFSDEWAYRKDIVKSLLAAAVGVHGVRIPVKDTVVLPVSKSLTRKFLKRHHIRKYAKSRTNMGLFHDDDLVAIMTFNESDDGQQHVMVRFCEKTGVHVRGGAKALLDAYCQVKTGEVIVSVDRRWADDVLYSHLGFTKIAETPPAFTYVRKNRRLTCQEFVNRGFFEAIDENGELAEDFQEYTHLYKIFDCGQTVWAYTIDK